MKHTGKVIVASFVVCCAGTLFAVPEVTSCTMEQRTGSRLAVIKYTLSEAPAVVTLDIETNCVVNAQETWTSIGGEHIWNAEGAVWRKVTTDDIQDGKYVIKWHPDQSWKDPNGNGFVVDGTTHKIRAKVTAWAIDNTPDYMVVDLSEGAQPNTQKYYPSVDFLPGSELGQTGAITNNTAYRKSKLVMRKIMAKGVEWTMGSVNEPGRSGSNEAKAREATHPATLTNNYYIGVFEITQAQWAFATAGASITPTATHFTTDGQMRPMDRLCYNVLRRSSSKSAPWENNAYSSNYNWPNPPKSNSFLGTLSSKTGIEFDLPSEAQWEFAARAGHGEGLWGDGSTIVGSTSDSHLDEIGRYRGNGGSSGVNSSTVPDASSDPSSGTAICGSYKPNSWGLYDMHGNVCEICLDFFEANVSSYGGNVNIDYETPTQTRGGTPMDVASGEIVLRGGSFLYGTALNCRSAWRDKTSYSGDYYGQGCRVVCTAGLK